MAIADRKLLRRVTELENDRRQNAKKLKEISGRVLELDKQNQKLLAQNQKLENMLQKLEAKTDKLEEQHRQLKEKLKHPFHTVVAKVSKKPVK